MVATSIVIGVQQCLLTEDDYLSGKLWMHHMKSALNDEEYPIVKGCRLVCALDELSVKHQRSMFEVAGVHDHVLGGCAIVWSDIVFDLAHFVYVSGTFSSQSHQMLI